MIGPASVSVAGLLASYDFELPLRDALADPDLDPVRYALASIAIGTGLDDGHLTGAELAEAARQFAADRVAGVSDEAGEAPGNSGAS